MTRAGAIALLALLSVFWGANWPIMKVGLEAYPPWVFRALSSTAGGVGLLLIARAGGLPLGVPRGEMRGLLVAAALNITAWNILVLYGIARMNSGRAAILAYTMPLWATLIGTYVLREPMTRRQGAGLALGVVAVAILFAGGGGGAVLAGGLAGPVCVVLAALAWGAGTVAVKHYRFTMPVTVLTAWQHLIGVAPIVVVAALWDYRNLGEPTLAPTLAVLYNMTVAPIFCYWAYFTVVRHLPVVVSTVGTLMVPVLGVAFTALAFGEPPSPTDYLALAAIVAAVWLVLSRPAGTR